MLGKLRVTAASNSSVPPIENTNTLADVNHAKEVPVQNPNRFTEVKSKTDHPFSVELDTDGYKYTINESGIGKRTDNRSKAQTFNFGLSEGEALERHIYFAKYKQDLLLVCEYYLNDGTGGLIVRLDGRTLKLKWKGWIPTFNVGESLLDKNYAYVTGIGFVGKVDLESGVYVWQHEILYGQEDSAFNNFEVPELSGNLVRFTESENYLRKSLASVEVDLVTGKILKIER